MKKLAFGYIRRSSYKQLENNSVEIQKQHIQEFANRNQLIVPDEFIMIEDVTSAYTKRANKRKALMQLANKMIELNIAIVIFYDTSRMDRTGYSFVLEFYRPLLEKLPTLKVYTTDSNRPIDPSSPEIQMKFLIAQYESEIKSERAIGNLITDLKEESNFRPGAKVPFGYNQIKKRLYPNEYAEIVLFIFFLYSWGHSLNKIAFLLNEANIPSPKGKMWGSSTIENIIKNPVYSGNLVWQVPKFKDGENKFFFPNTHTAIANTHFTQLHNLNKQLQQKFGRFDTSFLFLNKIQCAHCNQVLSTQNGSTKRKGIKYEYLHYVCKKCNYKIDAGELDLNLIPLIMNKVHSLVLNEKFKISTLELLVQMVKIAKDQIGLKNEEIKILSQKLMLSKKLDDYELQQYISSSIERHNNEVETLERCIENINDLFETVNQNFFFSRFKNILINEMDSIETRLIILYFVDVVELTTDNNFNIRYKTNIFEELDIG